MIKSTTSLVLFYLLFAGCAKEKFSSESNWLAPLIETELTLGNLIPDSLIRKNNDNTIDIVFEEAYGITSIQDILVIPDRIDSIEVTLSSLVLEDRSFIDTLTLQEIYPASVFLNGQKADLPAQDVQTNQGTKLDVSKEFFSTATFVQGWIDITISNDLPVTAELMEFELINDDGTNTVVASGTFTDLAPNTTQTQSYTLAGKTVKGKLELRVKRVKTKASDEPVLIDIKKGLRITFGVRGLKPQSATAVFPAQNLVERNDETTYSFGGAELTQVNVKTGSILMKVESSIEEAIILQYKIPQSSSPGQSGPIYKEWKIPAAPKGQRIFIEERFPIDGFVIHLYGEKNSVAPYFNHVYNELAAKIEYTGIERTLSLSDKIKIEFGLVDVIPELVIGDPGLHNFTIKDSLELPALKNFKGNLSLEDASLELNFYNSFGIESLITTNEIIGQNTGSNKNVKLTSPALSTPILLKRAVNLGTSVKPDEQTLILNKGNSNIKQFIENLPDQIVPNIQVKVRPNGTLNQSDFAFDYSKLLVNFKLEVPLIVGLEDLTVTETRKSNLFEYEQISNVKEAKLSVLASNDFPIEAVLELTFLDDNGVIMATAFKGENNSIEEAETDPITGKTSSARQSELVAKLSRSDMLAIQNATQIRITGCFSTTDAKRYKMYSDYRIKLKIVSDITYENKL
jgi:hypothetical protein